MAEEDFDVNQGVSWTERTRFGVYGVALDYGDTLGKKNAFIDAVHQLALRRTLRRFDRRFAHAMDFGCGGGRLLPLLSSFADDTYGVDRTPACLQMAREAGVVPDNRLICWREGPLPFGDGFFDLFLSAYVLLTTVALDTLLPELARVTQSGGIGLLLEQVETARGLTLARYHRAFERDGFAVVDEFAIRRSAGSRWLQLASRRLCPPWLARQLAGLEIATMQTRRYDERMRGYYDYVFALQRL